MKAAYINAYGNVEQLIVGTLPKPEIAPDQVLISVIAAGVNPVDFHVRNGMFRDSGMHSLPLVPGWDAAGLVAAVGAQVSHLKVGDAVFVHSPIGQQGAYADYLAVDAQFVAPKPDSLSFVQSAAVPLAALTAWQGLLHDGQLKAGQRLLIHNAAGGVGSFAVQIARHVGARVMACASARNRDYVLALGADEYIDYQQAPFEDQVDAVDLVFAATGGNDILPRSLQVIKPGGRLVSTFDDMPQAHALECQVEFTRMWVKPDSKSLSLIAELIDQHRIRVPIDSVYPLEHAHQAMQRSESGRAVGKIVLNLNPSISGL
ncbi:Zn-dependent oxidoreductase [Marinobacterium aestuarii]|uniref:Zn-dependent oxidoreductase n=1 Tax=Marinobacterium aestuarii TaxID=1821621 RepID=A0A1A9F0L6_9GAMM|nr:NADP-dependent oxidoreductase [Marinobacterium aestuarii]ANG63441.1 Zn-dependent oxidoreductase [Marinobacterium aestuarii]